MTGVGTIQAARLLDRSGEGPLTETGVDSFSSTVSTHGAENMADLERLLARTSRTFALAIPTLPTPPRREVAAAYLIFRIADTFEDAASWPRAQRLAALAGLEDLLRTPSAIGAARLATAWVRARPCEDEGYLELLSATPAVLAELDGFTPARRAAVVRHALRTIEGMAGFVASSGADGALALATEADLRRYCYVVAGIVGELLTDLFLDAAPGLAAVEPLLRARAAAFGEGLQLVNILKDADADARDGRVYLPPSVGRSRVLALAREDLDVAAGYVRALQEGGAPRGVVEFCAFPVLLARATLDEVERRGAGAKTSRSTVAGLLERMSSALDRGAPVLEAP
jgi:farnesyl-diphosphate farnesyltransferase